jgi:hypothetical protein
MLRQSFTSGFLIQGGWLLNGELVQLGTGADLLHQDFADQMISISLDSDQNFEPETWSVFANVDADVLSPEGGLRETGHIGRFRLIRFMSVPKVRAALTKGL